MRKVLLIDDDSDDRELFEMALKSLTINTQFIYSPNGEAALELACDNTQPLPDYIFLDLNMPRINGLDYLSAIRSKNIYPGIPVFIYTTSSVGQDIDKCMELGGQLVTKHSSFTSLCEHLEKLIV